MRKSPSQTDQSFDPKDFFRTFSYREVLTALCLTLMFWALIGWIFYCRVYDWYPAFRGVLIVATFMGTVVLNHIFYKREHRRPNNYMGRTFTDYLLFLFIWIAAELINLESFGELTIHDVDPGVIVLAIMFVIFWTILLELVLAGVKRLLNKFKCRVF